MTRAWDTRSQFYTAVPSQAAIGFEEVLDFTFGRRWILAIHMRTVIYIGIGKWGYDSHADMAF